MSITNKKLDAIRRLVLGPLYDECKNNPMGVKRADLEAQFEELKGEGCIGADCGFDELIKLCQLKNHYPSCLSNDRGCIENIGERQTGIKKFYFDQYKRAKQIEDDESSSDEEDEIECPICTMNEDADGIRLVETVTNTQEEQGALSCGHLVHKSCLIRESVTRGLNKAKCPLCNKIFELDEVPVPERDRDTTNRYSIRRAVFNGTQMGRPFYTIADVYGETPEGLLERIGMTAEEASVYYSIPIEEINPPVNRRLDFDDSDDESDELDESSLIDYIVNLDLQIAIQLTEERIERENGSNDWVSEGVINSLVGAISSLGTRRDLEDALRLFILIFNGKVNIESLSLLTIDMFEGINLQKTFGKLILLHIIKKSSVTIHDLLIQEYLEYYNPDSPGTYDEVIKFIFEAYERATRENDDVDTFSNYQEEQTANDVFKNILESVLDSSEIRSWESMTDVSALIRDWLRTHYPGEIEEW